MAKKIIRSVFLVLSVLAISATAESYTIERTQVSLQPYRNSTAGLISVRAQMTAPFPDGALAIGWNADSDVHITLVDKSLKRERDDIILKGHLLQGMTALPDHTVLALVIPYSRESLSYKYSNPAYLIKYDKEGKQIFKTHLLGGNGFQKKDDEGLSREIAPPCHPIGYHDGKIALFMEIDKQWGPGRGVHEGDRFMILDSNGTIDRSVDWSWSSSHSVCHQMTLTASGEFITIQTGDGYPFGVQFINRSRPKQYRYQIIWPDEDQRTDSVIRANNSTVGAGVASGVAEVGGNLFVLIGTTEKIPIDQSALDILLVGASPEGNVLFRNWVRRDSAKNFKGLGIVPFEDGALIAFDEQPVYPDRSPGDTYLAFADREGAISRVEKIPYKSIWNWMSPLFRFPDGSAGWTYAPDERTIEIFRVRSEKTGGQLLYRPMAD
ncbi:MAG: hypothetical protein JXA20_14320 [Spirochaetes bacterium]|nr:hypothetical protein [Spirochaetota bacterium]